MKVTFFNSAWVSVFERFVLARGRWKRSRLRVRYGVIEHPEAGLVLIDTGYGPSVTTGRLRSRGLKLYNHLFGPRLDPNGALYQVLTRLGHSEDDVRVVIVTHFHPDHICELKRFPNARIVAHKDAYDALMLWSWGKRLRHGIFTEFLPSDLSSRLTDVSQLSRMEGPLKLGECYDVFGDGMVLAVDLPGHAIGHFGVCFAHCDPPLLYAVDVQWVIPAIIENRRPGLPGSLVATAPNATQSSSCEKVRKFHEAGGTVLLCHDPDKSSFDHV